MNNAAAPSTSSLRAIAHRWRWVSLLGLSAAVIYWVVGQAVVAASCLPGWDEPMGKMADTFLEHMVSARTFGLVLDVSDRQSLLWSTIGLLVLCYALRRWTDAAVLKRVRMAVLLPVAAVAGGAMSVAAVVMIWGDGPESCCGGPSLTSNVQTIRSQLELYQVQHDGKYPTLAQMWTNLLIETEADGRPGDGSGDEFGPNLSATPVNFHTGGSDIAADNTGSWQYNEQTGEIRAVVSPSFLSEYPGLSPADFVAAPFEMIRGSKEKLTASAAFWMDVRTSLEACAHSIGRDPIVTAFLVGVFGCGWYALLRRLTRGRDPLRCAATIAAGCTCVALAGFLFSRTGDRWALAAVMRLYFSAALLWGWSTLVTLQFRWEQLRQRHDGSVCPQCDYDLTGTRQAGRCACPECGAKIVVDEPKPEKVPERLRAA